MKQKLSKRLGLAVLALFISFMNVRATLNDEFVDLDSTIFNIEEMSGLESVAFPTLSVKDVGLKNSVDKSNVKKCGSSFATKALAFVGALYGLNKGHDALRWAFGDTLYTIGVMYGMAFTRVEGGCDDHSKKTENWNEENYEQIVADAVPIWTDGISAKYASSFKLYPGYLSDLDLKLQDMCGWKCGNLFYQSSMDNQFNDKSNLIANSHTKRAYTVGFRAPVYAFQCLQAVPYYLKFAYKQTPEDFGKEFWNEDQPSNVSKNLISNYKNYNDAIESFYQGLQLSFFNKTLGAMYLKDVIKFGKNLPTDIKNIFKSSHDAV
ncbi:MAG: hypothetical protein IJC57_01105, partial [Clostridia bacterium]|nr:hypothetical protein [Clostridia bacterium]